MKKKIALILLLICSLVMVSHFSIITQIELSDAATMALLGFGVLACTFFIKRAIKVREKEGGNYVPSNK